MKKLFYNTQRKLSKFLLWFVFDKNLDEIDELNQSIIVQLSFWSFFLGFFFSLSLLGLTAIFLS